MNLEDLTMSGVNQIHIADSLNASLMKLSVKRGETTQGIEVNELIVYVDKQDASSPTSERKQYVFELTSPLLRYNDVSDELLLQLNIVNNDVKFKTMVERKISVLDETYSVLAESVIEELESFPITLFEGENYLYTNYENAEITVVYPKNIDLNKIYLNNAIYGGHRLTNTGDFGLDDIYFKDAFTKTGDELKLEVDNAEIKCLTSKNNKFSIDEDGNLTVNSVFMNSGLDINEQTVCNIVYPVGSIYMSINSADPSTLFGGTWEQLKDRFLLGVGDTYLSGTMGGESEHTLSQAEMPRHKHGVIYGSNASGVSSEWKYSWNSGLTSSTNGRGWNSNAGTIVSGGNQPHNNMPPYLTVYMWKRIS